MGILDKFFGSMGQTTDYTLLNDKVYNIRKDPDDQHKIEIWFNGKKDRVIQDSDVIIQNDQLASKWPYKFFFLDILPDMSECSIHESAGAWYIRCNNWVPVNMGLFPNRIPISGPVSNWFDYKEQVFVKLISEGRLVEILTSSGESKTVYFSDVHWVEGYPEYLEVWYMANVNQTSMASYDIKVGSPALRDIDIIVDGKMVWDTDTLKWVSKESVSVEE